MSLFTRSTRGTRVQNFRKGKWVIIVISLERSDFVEFKLKFSLDCIMLSSSREVRDQHMRPKRQLQTFWLQNAPIKMSRRFRLPMLSNCAQSAQTGCLVFPHGWFLGLLYWCLDLFKIPESIFSKHNKRIQTQNIFLKGVSKRSRAIISFPWLVGWLVEIFAYLITILYLLCNETFFFWTYRSYQ